MCPTVRPQSNPSMSLPSTTKSHPLRIYQTMTAPCVTIESRVETQHLIAGIVALLAAVSAGGSNPLQNLTSTRPAALIGLKPAPTASSPTVWVTSLCTKRFAQMESSVESVSRDNLVQTSLDMRRTARKASRIATSVNSHIGRMISQLTKASVPKLWRADSAVKGSQNLI